MKIVIVVVVVARVNCENSNSSSSCSSSSSRKNNLVNHHRYCYNLDCKPQLEQYDAKNPRAPAGKIAQANTKDHDYEK